RGLHEGGSADGAVDVKVIAPDEVTVETVGRDDARLGTSFLPNDRVSALAYQAFREAVVVTVPKNTEVSEPVFLTVTGAQQDQAHGHVLVRVESAASATVVLEYRGSSVYADNVEFVVEDGGRLTSSASRTGTATPSTCRTSTPRSVG